MNRFEFFQNVQLTNQGAVEVVTVSGMTDDTITRPGNQKEFFEQIQLDENGAIKVYIKQGLPPTPGQFSFATNLLFKDCGVLVPDTDYYTAGIAVLTNGVTLYTDNTLSTTVSSSGTLYLAEFVGASAIATFRINSDGVIYEYTLC